MSKVSSLFTKLVLNVFMSPITIAKVSARVYAEDMETRKKWWPYAIPSVGLFVLFIAFHVLNVFIPGCWSIAWFFYLFFICQITAVRIRTRELYGINGNACEDFFASMILYPNVTTQLDLTTKDLLNKGGISECNLSNVREEVIGTSFRAKNDQDDGKYWNEDTRISRVNHAYEEE